MLKTLKMPRSISEEKRNAAMVILGNTAFAKHICNLLAGKFVRARVRFVDDKIACCSQVCDNTCPHYADCQEFELIIRESGPKAEWEKIGLGMYALKKETNDAMTKDFVGCLSIKGDVKTSPRTILDRVRRGCNLG